MLSVLTGVAPDEVAVESTASGSDFFSTVLGVEFVGRGHIHVHYIVGRGTSSTVRSHTLDQGFAYNSNQVWGSPRLGVM